MRPVLLRCLLLLSVLSGLCNACLQAKVKVTVPRTIKMICSAKGNCTCAPGWRGPTCDDLIPTCAFSNPCPATFSCINSNIRTRTTSDVDTMRQNITDYLWKGRGIPHVTQYTVNSVATPSIHFSSATTTSTVSGVDLPAATSGPLPNLRPLTKNITRIIINMPLTQADGGGEFVHVGYHLIPLNSDNNKRKLLIAHQGHAYKREAADFGVYGVETAARKALENNIEVLLLCMPLMCENLAPTKFFPLHDTAMPSLDNVNRSVISFFIEPTVLALDYILENFNFPNSSFESISMTGISGGGWSTHVVSAIDTRINFSFPVAGSLPCYLPGRVPCGSADLEQDFHPFWNWNSTVPESITDIKDIYILSSKNRKNIQILNLNDNCCFSGPAFKNYDNEIRSLVQNMTGYFKVYSDVSHSEHLISDHVVDTVILPHILNHTITTKFLLDSTGGYGYTDSTFGEFRSDDSSAFMQSILGLGNYQLYGRGTTNSSAYWKFRNIVPGKYSIFVTWNFGSVGPASASNVTYIIGYSGNNNNNNITMYLSQRSPNFSFIEFGVPWQLLGNFTTPTDELVVTVIDQGDGNVYADGVFIDLVEAGTPLCINRS